MIIENAHVFNLKYTLESGQSFRWNRVDDSYYGVVEGCILKIQQREDTLFIDSSRKAEHSPTYTEWVHYFDLSRDLSAILTEVNVDAYIDRAINRFWGMRLLNQELWETIASFILSQNNNMARIRGLIRSLSEKFGQKLTFEGYVDYSFPTPEVLTDAGVDEIFACGTGYRASYLWHAAQNVANGDLVLDPIKRMSYSEAKMELMKLKGIGEKVADCICLFSLGHLEALPVDVWIKRIFEQIYLRKRATSREIREFARDYFGEFVGYAQQYLFHYAQNEPSWADAEHLALRYKRVRKN
ncbi:DNA-3-methyladenine glycosylase 2 family protein [Candidatus Poribacteria bacterium]|nr:DNA-3-methyladenine glycosylase 2 family protein [Candidatus Poribacteria bacterium]MYF55587.1 DNA-3-methyladenine glycosylase 2 family protein [Candidatus Poribacteria bacterium]